MSTSNRMPYLTANTLTQELLNNCADNLLCSLNMICEIEAPNGDIIKASDRNIYVGEEFFEALLTFPEITRTIGEWLSPEVEFSTLQLQLSNVDGRFNNYLPSGVDYASWIGNSVTVKLGLSDKASTYFTIFSGKITDVGGFKRDTKSIILIARDAYDKLNVQFPNVAFGTTAYPYLENDKEGLIIPLIFGDWTVNNPTSVSIPAIVVNGNDGSVYASPWNKIKCVISVNALAFFDTAKVYYKKSSDLFLIPSGNISNVNVDNNYFEITQGFTYGADATVYEFTTGDEFYVSVKGEVATGDNLLTQAKKILTLYGGVLVGELSSDWAYFETKLASVKSRIWVQEQQSVIQYVSSMLEQVSLEPFIDKNLKISINALQFDEFVASPNYTLKNWDIEKDSLNLVIDEKTNINKMQGVYNYQPISKENGFNTAFYVNNAAIAQIGKTITKQIVFPNLYIATDAEYYTQQILKLSSSYFEIVECNLTWRNILKDIGDFVLLKLNVGESANFDYVPALIRQVSYDPNGFKLRVKLWSFQMMPFGSWNPGYAGIVGGQNAVITKL